jgi:hypothetical protein
MGNGMCDWRKIKAKRRKEKRKEKRGKRIVDKAI